MSHASPRSTQSLRRGRCATPQRFELLQVVYARQARPELGLQRSESGAIVEVFERPHRAYLCRFLVNDDATTRAEGAFTAGELAVSPPTP